MSRMLTLAVAAMLGLGPLADGAAGQAPRSAKGQFVGTWTLVSIYYVHSDGRKIEPFGPDAKGMLVFDATGHFETQIMAANRPKFASNNRTIGTPEEYKATSHGVVAYFGSYSVNEADSIVTLHIERSSFPNWDGTDQKRSFSFVNDELRYTAASSTANPAESAQLMWKRAR
ncbi:MAG: lipocalin-like domain-containing protein [Terriglobia bacterium]